LGVASLKAIVDPLAAIELVVVPALVWATKRSSDERYDELSSKYELLRIKTEDKTTDEELERLRMNITTLESNNKVTGSDIAILQSDISQLVSGSRSSSESLSQLQTQVSKLETGSRKSSESLSQLQTEVSKVEVGSRKSSESLSQLQTQVSKLETGSRKSSESLSQLQTEVSKLEAGSRNSSESLSQLQNDVSSFESLNERISTVEQQAAKSSEDAAVLAEDFSGALKAFQGLYSSVQEDVLELQGQQERRSSFEQDVLGMFQAVISLEQDIASVKNQLTESDKGKDQESALNKQAAELRSLKQRLEVQSELIKDIRDSATMQTLSADELSVSRSGHFEERLDKLADALKKSILLLTNDLEGQKERTNALSSSIDDAANTESDTIEQLKGQLSTFQSEIEALSSKVNAVDSISEATEVHQNSLAELAVESKELKSGFNSLSEKLASILQTQSESPSNAELTVQVETLRDQVKATYSELDDTFERLDDLSTRKTRELAKNMQDLDARLTSFDSSSKVELAAMVSATADLKASTERESAADRSRLSEVEKQLAASMTERRDDAKIEKERLSALDSSISMISEALASAKEETSVVLEQQKTELQERLKELPTAQELDALDRQLQRTGVDLKGQIERGMEANRRTLANEMRDERTRNKEVMTAVSSRFQDMLSRTSAQLADRLDETEAVQKETEKRLEAELQGTETRVMSRVDDSKTTVERTIRGVQGNLEATSLRLDRDLAVFSSNERAERLELRNQLSQLDEKLDDRVVELIEYESVPAKMGRTTRRLSEVTRDVARKSAAASGTAVQSGAKYSASKVQAAATATVSTSKSILGKGWKGVKAVAKWAVPIPDPDSTDSNK
jgi:chromosome segregation ATPase